MYPYSLDTHYRRMENTLKYGNIPILTYEINFPIFKSTRTQDNLDFLNDYYQEKASLMETFAAKAIFPLAASQYKDLIQMDAPFHPYDLRQDFSVTYSQLPLLSLYYDQYLYTGGTHGNTERYSNTWNLKTNSILKLKDFFPTNPGYKNDIVAAVNAYISKEQSCGNSKYYNDKQDASSNFNENNFYLVPEGIVIYFRQYEIAPYSSGIPQFLIPFDSFYKINLLK